MAAFLCARPTRKDAVVFPAFSMTETAREARVRRALWRQGRHVLRKDRARSINLDHFGGYMVVDADSNFIVAGARYDLSLDDLEAQIAEDAVSRS